MILQKTRTQEKKVFKKVKKQVAMSHVDEFCAQQGNVLRKPLKFEGQMVRNLYPNENVCRQLHERWKVWLLLLRAAAIHRVFSTKT
jgi:hypothetical protein